MYDASDWVGIARIWAGAEFLPLLSDILLNIILIYQAELVLFSESGTQRGSKDTWSFSCSYPRLGSLSIPTGLNVVSFPTVASLDTCNYYSKQIVIISDW